MFKAAFEKQFVNMCMFHAQETHVAGTGKIQVLSMQHCQS